MLIYNGNLLYHYLKKYRDEDFEEEKNFKKKKFKISVEKK